ncbi:unnamed protein product [Didymodactylos carnosus]|uniref:Uncharacterized protein n=2 Tax=Didymodactylos carnosus TaxID=1234261 RepID=A0A816A8K5_9BILA|nr:unnamed protein product [Didymodactylos carnosus]CAF4466797.1 unnamed protein product [Didymodactylos carnosus]
MDASESFSGSNLVVLWLDDHICRDDNCQSLKSEFRDNTNILLTLDSVESCRRCLPKLKNRQLFCIIQGKYAKEIVPDIVRITPPSLTPFVYIFCLNMEYLIDWASEQECVLKGGMYHHEKDLLKKMTTDIAEYIQEKLAEYRLKKDLCEQWAAKLTKRVDRYRQEKCAVKYVRDPLDGDSMEDVTEES